MNRLSPWGYLDFERTWGTFTVVQFGRREDVRESGKCCGKSVEGSGAPTSRVQREIYPTNGGGGQCSRGEKTIRVGCDRVGVEVRGGARPGALIDHVEVLAGGGSVKSDQVPRGKLWRVIKSTFICFCQVGDDIALLRLIGDDVHPYQINYCDGPISSRARQLNRGIAEVPRVSDRNVVNVASSKMTAPLMKLGPCSGKRAYQHA